MHQPKSAPANRFRSAMRGVPLALGLAVALMLLSFSRIVGNTQSALFHTDVIDAVFAGDIMGTALARNIALFGAALILLHLAYGLVCLALARLSCIAWPSDRTPLSQRIFLTFIALTIWLLAQNAAHFPRTTLGNPYAKAMKASVLGFSPATWLGGAIVVGIAVMVVMAAIKWWRTGSAQGRRRTGMVMTAAVAVTATAFAIPFAGSRQEPTPGKPNVILIGFDSLRHDLIAAGTSPHVMPNFEAFLTQSVAFSDSTTPLARTFPSWVTILSGRDPHTTGAVVNLLPRDTVHEGTTLGAMLRKQGYSATYAIDDVRFSNIDESYGFDRIITPPIGAAEFVIGFFADTPLSNLVLNTSIGHVLFPFSAGNRAVAPTYDPDAFIDRIAREVDFHAQPMFLAAHLTLPHWPYTWANAPPSLSDPGKMGDERWPDYYLHAVRRADQQFADLMNILRAKGVLDNAIVIVFSDHGETFGWGSDSVVPVDGSEIVKLNAVPTWGHGTSVFTPEQYHTVLAIRSFGSTPLGQYRPGVIDAPASVEDITPTIAELLALGPHEPFDGRSLVALVRDQPGAVEALADRIRMTETEFNPPGLADQTGKLVPEAVAEAAHYYQLDPVTDRLELKRALVGKLLRQRQYAAFSREYLLAAIPLPGPDDGSAGYRYLIRDQKSGKHEFLAGAPDEKAPAEVRRLWASMLTKFGPSLASVPAATPLTARVAE